MARPPLDDLTHCPDDAREHGLVLTRFRQLAAEGPDRPAARSVAASDLLEAVLAVHRSALRGQKRHLRGLAADGAGHVVHRAGPRHAAAFAAQRPALGAATGLVHEALGLVELLLAGRKGELDAAITAGQRLVDEGSHRYLLGTKVSPVPALPLSRGPPGQR